MPNLELIPPRVVRGLGVRPVPSELGRGGCRGLACCVAACCLVAECFIAYQSVTPVRASPNPAVN